VQHGIPASDWRAVSSTDMPVCRLTRKIAYLIFQL
jgi:hypothetical protein